MATDRLPTDATTTRPTRWFSNPWVVFLFPLAVYVIVGSFEPARPQKPDEKVEASWIDLGLTYDHYPWVYALKVFLTTAAAIAVARGYPPRMRIRPLAVVVGTLGVVAWVALTHIQSWLVSRLDIELATEWLGGQRAAYNPLEQLGHTPAGYLFLAIRWLGLAAIVPLVEEMFLRGFLMRYPIREDWWNVLIGTPDRFGIAAAVVLPMLMHPQEALAALVWFGAVAWLAVRTKNVWDCIAAHSITNLLLGVYVLVWDEWWLM